MACGRGSLSQGRWWSSPGLGFRRSCCGVRGGWGAATGVGAGFAMTHLCTVPAAGMNASIASWAVSHRGLPTPWQITGGPRLAETMVDGRAWEFTLALGSRERHLTVVVTREALAVDPLKLLPVQTREGDPDRRPRGRTGGAVRPCELCGARPGRIPPCASQTGASATYVAARLLALRSSWQPRLSPPRGLLEDVASRPFTRRQRRSHHGPSALVGRDAAQSLPFCLSRRSA